MNLQKVVQIKIDKKMKKVMVSMLLGLFVAGIASCQNSDGYKTIQEEEFVSLSKKPEVVILDVRTPMEFKEGHIEQAQLIDYNGRNFETEIAKLDKSKKYLVYCKSGGRSASASEILTKKGFKVFNLDGGISSWSGKVVQ
jgi:rhodanese-related sulfurtransferase